MIRNIKMEKINFEEAMNELEVSVKKLECGNMSLVGRFCGARVRLRTLIIMF